MHTGGNACESVFILGGDLMMKCSNMLVISELRGWRLADGALGTQTGRSCKGPVCKFRSWLDHGQHRKTSCCTARQALASGRELSGSVVEVEPQVCLAALPEGRSASPRSACSAEGKKNKQKMTKQAFGTFFPCLFSVARPQQEVRSECSLQ